MKSVILAGLTLLLSGCLFNPVLPVRPPAEDIGAFALVGRLAIRQGEARHYVKIDWRHQPQRDEMLLTTPLGQGLAELVRDAGGARLKLADRREFAATDWGELTEQVFGFRLPLDLAATWLLGRPAGTDGWTIEVIERESDAAHALPAVIELERDDIKVRLKIDEWLEVK